MALARIVDPKPAWADEFRDIAARLSDALGSRAIRIDHIGSTSVPGLAAKDVIDVQVTVPQLDAEDLAAALAGVGFRMRPGAWNDYDHTPPGADEVEQQERAKLYFREPPGERLIHVHVRAAGRANQRYALLFRDYLRANQRAAATYGEFKRRLAALDIETGIYAEIKDPVCDLVMISAEKWAAETGWRPD